MSAPSSQGYVRGTHPLETAACSTLHRAQGTTFPNNSWNLQEARNSVSVIKKWRSGWPLVTPEQWHLWPKSHTCLVSEAGWTVSIRQTRRVDFVQCMNRDKEWTSGEKWGWDEESKKFWQWGQYREGFYVSLVTPIKLFNLSLPLDCKEIQPVHRKGNQSWIFTGRTDAEAKTPKGNQSWIFIGRADAEAETPTLWLPEVKDWFTGKKPRCWERLKAGGEGDDRGWDGCMASPTQWTWVWVNSWSWWWTGRPGVLRSMGSQRIGHDWVTALNLPSFTYKLHVTTMPY